MSTTNPDQRGTGSNGNEGVLHIPQSSRTGASADFKCIELKHAHTHICSVGSVRQ